MHFFQSFCEAERPWVRAHNQNAVTVAAVKFKHMGEWSDKEACKKNRCKNKRKGERNKDQTIIAA